MNAPMPMTSGWYSAQELAGLPGMPGSDRKVRQKAQKNLWPVRAKARGKGVEYPLSCLPAATQQALLAKQLQTVSSCTAPTVLSPADTAPPVPAGFSIPCADLTDKQRMERDARSGVLAAVKRLRSHGVSQEAAITTLLTSARAGQLDPVLDKMLRLARDARGRAGDGYPSPRTLKRWLSAPDLAPKIAQRDMSIPAWAEGFRRHYSQPQKPSVEAAYRQWLREDVQPGQQVPSLHQVRRFLAKLGSITREQGRMGPRELKNIKPFIRRDWSSQPNDAWIADGHCFDAEVQHPLHGRPFRPEITVFIDGGTRRVTGWSLGLSENAYSVADALATGVRRCGLPSIVYGDNGAGYRANLLTDECTGLLARIHATPKFALPYNSQAKGIVERLHRTLWVAAAKQLPSYIGSMMDREARLAQFKLTRKALKHGGSMPLIPWDVFVDFIEAKVAEYNDHAHRSLGGLSPNGAWAAAIAKGWEADRLTDEELTSLFRPRVTRTIQRAEINLFTNIYFARELAEFHGMDAQIAYDIHDPSRIWVYTPEGRLICEAECNGNKRAAFPVAVQQQANERRAKGRLTRVDAKRDEILEELHGAPAIAAPSTSQVVIGGRVIDSAALSSMRESIESQLPRALAPEADETPSTPAEIAQPAAPASRSTRTPDENYDEWLDIGARIVRGEHVSEEQCTWHQRYQASAQYRAVAAKRKAAA